MQNQELREKKRNEFQHIQEVLESNKKLESEQQQQQKR